ncbi:ABC transporter ATP-binding protein [bacterium]|nr:ABC transporter ATP-binding protein [bacterium]
MLLVSTALSIIAPLFLKSIIDEGILGKNMNILTRSSIFYFALYLVMFYINYKLAIIMEKLGQNIMIRIKSDTFNKILKKPYSFFQENTEGTLISRVENDGESIRQLFTSNTITLISDSLMLIGIIFIMLKINAKLFLYILIFIIPFLLLTVILYSKFARPLFKKFREAIAKLSSFVVEYFKGMEIVKIFNRLDIVKNKLKDLNHYYYKTGFTAEALNIYFYNSITMLQIIGIAIILWFGGKLVLIGAATFGTLVLFINYMRQFFQPILRLANQIGFIEKAKASSERIFELQKDMDNLEFKGERNPTFENIIEFKNVCFSYDKKKEVLKNINLTIKTGSKIAIVGRTGGGKTTLIKLLLKLISPDKGEILIDGINIGDINTEKWRKFIGYISQDIFLFPGTLLDNLKFFDNSVSQSKVLNMCKKIGIMDIIERTDKGLNSRVSEGGKNFSKGEQQLLNIVRASIFKPKIFILDEATSTIDAKYEKKIVDALKYIAKDTTMIAIAHRISTIKDSQTIFVIRNGEIVERGTHTELLAKGNIYKNYSDIMENNNEG